MSADRTDSPRSSGEEPLPAGDAPRPLAEISQAPAAFEQFLDRNQKGIAVLAVALVAAAAGLVIYRGVEQGREQSGGYALHSAGDDLASLQEVVRDHSGSAAAGSARVLLAAQQWDEGQQDASIETLRGFLAGSPRHPARHTARASLGSKLMQQGKHPEARDVFDALLQDPGGRFLAPYALISLGDMARAEGDTERAEQFYLQASTDYPGTNFSQTATSRLAVLRAQLPVEIDPPPAPESDLIDGDFSLTPPPGLTPPPFLAPPTQPFGETGGFLEQTPEEPAIVVPPADLGTEPQPEGEPQPADEPQPAGEPQPADEPRPEGEPQPADEPQPELVEDESPAAEDS